MNFIETKFGDNPLDKRRIWLIFQHSESTIPSMVTLQRKQGIAQQVSYSTNHGWPLLVMKDHAKVETTTKDSFYSGFPQVLIMLPPTFSSELTIKHSVNRLFSNPRTKFTRQSLSGSALFIFIQMVLSHPNITILTWRIPKEITTVVSNINHSPSLSCAF